METLTELGQQVGQLLKQRRETVTVAESAAGGLVSAALLSVPGASSYFQGGGVIYTHAARRELLRLAEAEVAARGATEAFALVMARAARERLGTTWGLGETGAAGPDGNRYGDPAGHVALAIAGPVEQTAVVRTGSADREANMWRFAESALELLATALRQAETR